MQIKYMKIGLLCDERDIMLVKSDIARKMLQGLKIVTKTVALLDVDEYKNPIERD